jgi:hypothetical protein
MFLQGVMAQADIQLLSKRITAGALIPQSIASPRTGSCPIENGPTAQQ